MAKVKGYTFEVTGKGIFPLDMLRYDACFPTNPMSVDRIAICHHEREDYATPRCVTLMRYGDREPTAARWASFGWTVTKCEALR